MPKLSIIILSFNTKDYLKNLLSSIKSSLRTGFNLETIVVDNGSSDNTVLMISKNFPEVILIKNQKNLGFAKACNQGAKQAKGKFLLFLNSDTRVEKDTFLKMLAFLETEKVAAATCKLLLSSGKIDPSCHRGFPTPWNAFCYFSGLEKLFPSFKAFSGYHQTWKGFTTIHEVEVISGAFFMINKKIFETLMGFDERFFMYAEDIDLCKRIKDQNYKIFYFPKTMAIHFKNRSGRKRALNIKNKQLSKKNRQKAKEHFYSTMKIFYEKHYQKKYPTIVKYLVLFGIWLIAKFKN